MDRDQLHRTIAAETFNACWDLIERPDRTSGDDQRMLAAAFASRYHWELAGGNDEERSAGDWQIAHVAALLGLGELSLRYAQQCLTYAERNGWGDWRLASALEGVARAYAASSDDAKRDVMIARAKEAVGAIAEDEDRALIDSQLRSVPGYVESA